MTNQPTIFSQGMALKALSDPKFGDAVPELAHLVTNTRSITTNIERAGAGCSSCRKRKVVINFLSEIVKHTLNASPDMLRRIKTYYGVTSFMVNMREHGTGRIVCKII